MLSYEFYKAAHIFGLVLAFIGLTGSFVHVMNGGTRDTNNVRGLLAASHGAGLAIAFVAGFGLMARLELFTATPGWVMAKIVIWLVVGGLVMIPLRRPSLAKPLWWVLPIRAGLSAYIAAAKPF